jgi:DNA processing protein
LLDADEFADWLRLLETPQIGRESARRLLAAFGSAPAVFAAPAQALREVVGLRCAGLLGAGPPEFAARLAAARRWWQAGDDRHIVALGEALYPPLLLQTADPPLLLYVQGRVGLLSAPSLAVVGSRNPTPQGADNAQAFAAHLARDGLAVVSGLALGIDGAAHLGALSATDGAGTIAVVGTGLDSVYPGRHRALAGRIAGQGTLVSEYAPGTPPLSENFPQRNRIIAGLARGTLVVEAALRSGSLITARLAAEAGREVFAIPGSIHSPQSHGCHALIRQGAKLVESAQDIFEELGGSLAAGSPASGIAGTAEDDETLVSPSAGDPLLTAMGHDPVSLDALGARTGWPAQHLSTHLLELELEGRVARLPGGLYQRRAAI